MTQRHRYVQGPNGLCAETFGSEVACRLGFGASVHYSDSAHPYRRLAREGAVECTWLLQESSSAPFDVCGLMSDDPVHVLEWSSALVGMPDVAAEAEGRGEESGRRAENLEQAEAAAAAQRTLPEELADALKKEAGDYAWFPPRKVGTPEGAQALRTALAEGELKLEGAPEWQRAIEWLMHDDLELVYGPWPVRKFVLRDAVDHEHTGLRVVTQALNALEQMYNVHVWRPYDEAGNMRSWRIALVTWGGFLDCRSIETVCDDLASAYDPGPLG